VSGEHHGRMKNCDRDEARLRETLCVIVVCCCIALCREQDRVRLSEGVLVNPYNERGLKVGQRKC